MQRFSTLLLALACVVSLTSIADVASAQSAHAQSAHAQSAHAQSAHAQSAQLQRATSANAAVANVTSGAQARTPIAARDLARGTVLAAADIAWTDSVASRLGARDSVRAGWVARRAFRAGEVLEAPGVSPPDLVASGDVVRVIYTAPGVALTLRGTAIGGGAQGDEVYVRLDNRRRLRGVITAANTVRVM